MCVRQPRSVKSELLRTLVLGLITTHSSEALNLVLVDFKGGATFAGADVGRHRTYGPIGYWACDLGAARPTSTTVAVSLI